MSKCRTTVVHKPLRINSLLWHLPLSLDWTVMLVARESGRPNCTRTRHVPDESVETKPELKVEWMKNFISRQFTIYVSALAQQELAGPKSTLAVKKKGVSTNLPIRFKTHKHCSRTHQGHPSNTKHYWYISIFPSRTTTSNVGSWPCRQATLNIPALEAKC